MQAPGNIVVPRQPDDSDAQRKPVVAAHTGNGDEPSACSGRKRAPGDAHGRRLLRMRQHR